MIAIKGEDMMKIFFSVLGDSIAVHYSKYLKGLLGNEFEFYARKGDEEALIDLDSPVGTNGGNSGRVVNILLSEYKVNVPKYRYLILNCGLHDIVIRKEQKFCEISKNEYCKNLRIIIELTKKVGVKLIWVNTTPIDECIHNNFMADFKRFNKDVLEYNELAAKIMVELKIPVIDMYNFICNIKGDKYCDHVHYNENIRRMQAEFLYDNIVNITKNY